MHIFCHLTVKSVHMLITREDWIRIKKVFFFNEDKVSLYMTSIMLDGLLP